MSEGCANFSSDYIKIKINMGLIKVALKTGIIVYAVKYTYDEGAWSSADQALKFKAKMCNSISNNEFVQKGKSHFEAYVPMPEVKKSFK